MVYKISIIATSALEANWLKRSRTQTESQKGYLGIFQYKFKEK
jgi:hypothetical protein